MRITALEAFGIDSRILSLWEEAGYKELLPIQQHALQKGKVLDGGNAVIFSPTSSGKTFVGEMAAVKTARRNRRVIYLVPQKSLAEEKFREFQSRYASLGVRVVISTRDRKQHDRDIRRGRFHIAVIVFEKMHALMVSSPAILRNVGLVVIDELQMLGDKTRGPALEILLTKVLLAEDKPQIICLSAVLGNAKGLADWLGATLCEDHHRPVELRRGVLYQGVFSYVEHNGKDEGTETLGRQSNGTGVLAVIVDQVKTLVEKGEQCMVFCKSKKECMETARAIAADLDEISAQGALAELNDLEESGGKDYLTELLQRRAAYHNADLDWHQRDVIERGFRRNEIMVVCATTTLAMGMNLPARNVFIDTDRWDRDRTGKWSAVPITQAEYENISGRAGRLGLENDFGRAIIVAESAFDEDKFFTTYVKGELDVLEPALANVSLSQHVLNLVASRLCRTESEIRDILLASYTGSQYWRGNGKEIAFTEKLRQAMEHCVKGGLITYGKTGLEATVIGKLAAAKGVSVDTAIEMAAFVQGNIDLADEIVPFEVLWHMAGTEDGERIHFNLSTEEWMSGEYASLLNTIVGQLPPSVRRRMQGEVIRFDRSYEATKRVKRALLLHDWVCGLPTRQIEARFHCFSGSAYGLSSEFAWLAETVAGMAKILDWPDQTVRRLHALSEQLIHGVPAEGLPLTAIRVRGFSRGRITALVAKGWNLIERIITAPIDELRKLLTKPVAEGLRAQAARLVERAQMDSPPIAESTETTVEEEDHLEEAPEWDESYPPADDIGAHYLCDATIHLDGQAKKKRLLIRINEQELYVAPQSFETALKLAIKAKMADLGWLQAREIGSDDYHQVIRRLRKDIEPAGVDADKLVESNTCKAYRFSVPPDHISWNDARIRAHAPEYASLLDAAAEAA